MYGSNVTRAAGLAVRVTLRMYRTLIVTCVFPRGTRVTFCALVSGSSRGLVCRGTLEELLSQVGPTRVGDAWIGEDIHERRPAGLERPLERRP